MIDSDIVNDLPDDMRKHVIAAFHTIKESGVIESQLQRLLVQLGGGAVDESDDRMMDRIRRYRMQVIWLETLKELGRQEI